MEESAPQIVTSNLKNRKLRPERLNLDQIGALRACFFPILIIAFIPLMIRFGISVIELLYPLKPGGVFLLFFAGAVAYSWQLAASASLVIKYLRGERGNISQHLSFGFSALPKVLLSHSILILALFFLFPAAGDGGDFAAFIQSMLLVIVTVGFFLSWAPAFVAGEFFTKPVAPVDDDYEDFESMKLAFFKPRFFSGMGVIDLGIERSFYFCVNNFSLTVSLLLLGCCAKVIPAAIGVMLFGNSASFGTLFVESVLSSVAIGVIMLILGMAFLGSLPKEARAELELLEDTVISLPVLSVSRTRFLTRLTAALVVGLSVISTYFLIKTIKVEQSFPIALVPQNYDIGRSDLGRTANTFSLSFELDDKTNAYRWLDAERFRLQAPSLKTESDKQPELLASSDGEKGRSELKLAEPKKGGVLEAIQNKLSEMPTDKPAQEVTPIPATTEPKFNLIAPKEILLYSEKGELLDEKFFKPYYGKIRVKLTFDNISDEKSKLDESYDLESSIDSTKREKKLVYLLIDQTVQPLGSFSAGSLSADQEKTEK